MDVRVLSRLFRLDVSRSPNIIALPIAAVLLPLLSSPFPILDLFPARSTLANSASVNLFGSCPAINSPALPPIASRRLKNY